MVFCENYQHVTSQMLRAEATVVSVMILYLKLFWVGFNFQILISVFSGSSEIDVYHSHTHANLPP